MAALIAVSGCSLWSDDDIDPVDKPRISVFLKQEVAPEEQAAVERAIRAVDGVDAVVFESSEQAYEKYRLLMRDDPRFDPTITADNLPSSFVVTAKDLTAYRKIRDSSFTADLEAKAGVARVVFACATMAECKDTMQSPNP